MAAWMTDGDGSGCPEDGSTYLARVELPAAEQSAPPDVSCTCGRDKGPPILWCRCEAPVMIASRLADELLARV